MKDERSKEQRDWGMRQALANSRIEGFEPDEQFLQDWQALGDGRLSDEDFAPRALARAGTVDGAKAEAENSANKADGPMTAGNAGQFGLQQGKGTTCSNGHRTKRSRMSAPASALDT